ncbi:MAG: hypothetical protein JSU98_09535 [Gemmatimonadales bacterium]|nr:MAG: hypothetical protein JSU98_09535 [Gemmatimonadales bacterium]
MKCFRSHAVLGLVVVALPCLAAPSAVHGQEPEAISAALEHLEWRHIGPVNMGGRVSAIVGIPGDPKTFWVGGADGGVWKTVNGGITFEPQWQDEEAYSVGSLTVAPSDPNVVWLGSGEADPRNSVSYGLGVWRSTDGGSHWSHIGLDETERIKRIVVDPRNPDLALVCAMGREWGPNRERGVFKTTDGGETWEHVLYVDDDTGCSDLDMDLSNPRNLYAGMWTFRRRPWRFDDGGRETALYVSRDLGETWKKITTTPDEPMARIGVSVAQSRPNVVYLITEYPTAGTLFRSEDYGETWSLVNDEKNINFRPFYYSDVFVDPSDHNTLYTLSGGLSKSTDGGRTFQRIARDVHGDHQSIWIDPEDGEHVLSGSDGGMQVSYDGGENFHIFRNFSLAQYYHVFVDDRDPYYVCGGLQDNGNWCGPSRMNEPDGILPGEWYTVSGGDGFYTVPVPGQPNLVYSNAQGGYFRITDTNSGQTRSIEPHPWMVGSQGQGMYQARYRFNWDAPIHISPHDPATVYWGGNVVFRSRDYGHSWDVISPDLTTDDPDKQLDSGGEIYNDNTAAEFHTTILTIAESEAEPGVIWVGTDDGNVQVTRDDGATWTNVRDRVPGLPAEAWIGNIEASPSEAGTAFLAVDNHRLDDFTPHLWESTDYGRSWRDLSRGLPQDDYVKVVRQHPENADLLFVGMERGIYASLDRGRTWVDIRGNLPRVSVRGIKIQRQYNDLVIGTHGRGVWILDDIQPLVELSRAVDSDVHLFGMRTATDWEMWGRGSNLGQSRFTGDNPEEGAWVQYYLSPDAAALDEPVRIRITDASGSLVREFQDREAEPGLNRAVWDLEWAGATPVRGESGGGFFGGGGGPPAVPGRYTATLVVGDRRLSTEFILRGDPNVEASQADYEARFAAAMRARELQSELNRMVGAMVDLTGQIDGLVESIDGKGLTNEEAIRSVAGEAREALTTLEAEVRRPEGSMNYRDWPRLVEQLRFVVRGIEGPQARPTQGQMEVLGEVEVAAAQRAEALSSIVNGLIADLNALLEDSPKILTDWRRLIS